MKFKFSLETLLKSKEIKVNIIQKELAEILKETEKIKKLISLTEKNIEECHNLYMEKCSKGTIDAEEIMSFQLYFSSEEGKRKKLLLDLANQLEKENLVRDKLMESNKEKKSILKLKEKEFESFIKEVERKETKELDEISSGKFARKTK